MFVQATIPILLIHFCGLLPQGLVFVFAFVFAIVFILEATMPKRKGVFSGKSPPNVLEIYILMRLTWPNSHLLPVTYSFRHSIEHCDIKNVFIEAAEIKGCYSLLCTLQADVGVLLAKEPSGCSNPLPPP